MSDGPRHAAHSDSLAALRAHHRVHRCEQRCKSCEEVERHLDQIQAEIEILLARTAPDTTPASIQLHAY